MPVLDARPFVLAYFARKPQFAGVPESEQLACEYLERGLLDSMGLVQMIAEFEQTFGVYFSAEELQSPEFQTVGGLIDIIERLRSSANA